MINHNRPLGVILVVLGIFVIFLASSRRKWCANIRAAWKWRGGCPISRASYALTSVACILLGASIIILNDAVAGPLMATAFGLFVLTAVLDGFLQWRRKGFPVKGRCPHCQLDLDFRLVTSKCPRCGADIR